jgi:hypothetical protein
MVAMGTEKFNYIQPSVANGDAVVLQHAMTGDLVGGKANSPQGNTNDGSTIAPAGLFSTAPYLPDGKHPPKARLQGREKKCKALDDTCMGWANASGYCPPHAKKLAENPWAAE